MFGITREQSVRARIAKGLLLSAAGGAIVSAAPALAQDKSLTQTTVADAPDTAQTGDIVVTGTRRGAQTVKDTPLAISAFSGQTLEQNNVTSLGDLRKLDPSINIQSYGATQTKIVIRGIDSNVGSVTALYLDESPVQGGPGSNILGDGKPGIRLHDIDHVEVLKGPQGTLFGTSSMSGTIRVITKKPNLQNFEGALELDGASIDSGSALYKGEMALSGPLLKDRIAIRVVGWLEKGGGYIDGRNATYGYRPDENDQFVRGVRGEILFQVTPDFSLLAQATHQDSNVNGTQAFQIANGPYLNTSPTIELYKDHYDLYSLTADYDLGFGALVANGSYTKQGVLNAKDSTPTNISFGVNKPLSFVPRIWFTDYNGELRFSSKFHGPFQIVAGGYYEHSNNLYQTNAIQATVSGMPVCFSFDECRSLSDGGRTVYEFGTNSRRVIDQYAFYGQADLKILPTVTATAGIRYFSANIHDTVTNLQTVFPDFVFGRVTVPSVTGDTKGTNHKPSFNFSLLWQAAPEVSFYARAASGFRVGGVNTATSLAAAAGVSFPSTYGPDSLWDYEVGVKADLFNHLLYLDLTGYHIDWSNEQLSATAPGAFAYTINAGKTVSNGVEFNATLKPVGGFSVSGSVTYVDSKLDQNLPADVIRAGTIGYKGDRVPLTPRLSAAGFAEYDFPLGSMLQGLVQGNVTYHGDSYSSFNRANQFDTYLPAYTLVGAKIGVKTSDGVEIDVYGENLGNVVPYLGVVPSVDGTRIFTTAPRTIGGRLIAHF